MLLLGKVDSRAGPVIELKFALPVYFAQCLLIRSGGLEKMIEDGTFDQCPP